MMMRLNVGGEGRHNRQSHVRAVLPLLPDGACLLPSADSSNPIINTYLH